MKMLQNQKWSLQMNNEKLFKKMFKFAKELIDYQIYHRNRYIELKANREIPEGLIQRDFLFSELRLPRQIGKTTCLARLKGYLDAKYPNEKVFFISNDHEIENLRGMKNLILLVDLGKLSAIQKIKIREKIIHDPKYLNIYFCIGSLE